MIKFGLSHVSRGPPGPAGRDAFDLHHWCPAGLLELFRKSEPCTYFFNIAADGLIMEGRKGKSIGLKDRYSNKNAWAVKDFQRPVKLSRHTIYILPLERASYKIEKLQLAMLSSTIMAVALTSKVSQL